MAGGNRNQKRAAKAAKRKTLVAGRKRDDRLASSLSGRIAAAAACPVAHCLRTGAFVEAGIGHVVLARRLPSGELAMAFFLVDLLCLGVKDVLFREAPPFKLDEYITALAGEGQRMVDTDPAFARRIITDAAAFASTCGIAPARDYAKIVGIFGDIDAAAATEMVPFGRNGRPVFIPGPKDSLSRIREVEKALERTRGSSGFDIDMSPQDRTALTRIIDDLDTVTRGSLDEDDGLVIEHEDPAAADSPAMRGDDA